MKTYKIEECNVVVTEEDIDDIMTTALEGGINYWCDRVKVVGKRLGEYASDQISRGGTLILYDAESDDKWELNIEKLLHGIEMAIKERYYEEYYWYNEGELDACQIDAEVADVIIQFALFDEVMFG